MIPSRSLLAILGLLSAVGLAPLSAEEGGRSATAGRAGGAEPLHHNLTVRLDPAAHTIQATDRIDLDGTVEPGLDGAYRFVLHAGLKPEVLTSDWRLEKEPGAVTPSYAGMKGVAEEEGATVPLEGWRLIPDCCKTKEVELRWGGVIHHPLDTGAEYQRGFSETPGLISEEGVFLAGASHWVPAFGDGLVTFDLEIEGLDPSWDVVSQGLRSRHLVVPGQGRATGWSSPAPTEEIYLVAGPWTEYGDRAGRVELLAFLRAPDPALAARYLEAAKRYLAMYESILPPYPYPSFALVENFWETGYGMPGFTLLGPKIIRFPWILTSSWPHELLHDWWGNGVYADLAGGNWTEGLTAYMADHLFEEQKGEGAVYRRTALQKYTDFVRVGKDLPLSSFSARRSAATEAIGYGKAMMIFHMIRREVGDGPFTKTLSTFAREHLHTRAGWSDLGAAFGRTAGVDWAEFIRVWTTREGAPRIEIRSAEARRQAAGGAWEMEVRLAQTQEEGPFPLRVPAAVTMEGGGEPALGIVAFEGREGSARIACPGRPLRLDVDPSFDVMRRLDPLEVPPALSTLFGDETAAFVIPSSAAAEEQEAWRRLAAAWTTKGEPRIVSDDAITKLPEGTVWVLGWGNRHAEEIAKVLADQGVSAGPSGFAIAGKETPRAGASVVLVARRPGETRTAAAWLAADPIAAIPGLTRKLPHYTRYSYLAFKGVEPENTAKGMWEPTASPLVRNLGDGAIAPLKIEKAHALVDLPAVFDADGMKRSVEMLASSEMKGRGLGSPGLEAATTWVEKQMTEIGLEPAGDSGMRSVWRASGKEARTPVSGTNLLGRIAGTSADLADHPVLVMAHLDHLGDDDPAIRAAEKGRVHPGADDNASGVAVLLELARALSAEPKGARPVLFAVTSGEERGLLGSRGLLRSFGSGRLPFACVNLDTVGRLQDGKLYALNTDSAREWRFIFMGIEATTGTPIAIVPEPLDASDQRACLESGVPAVQLFTGPNADYHRPTDTAEKIDAGGMAKVAEAAHEAVAYLAGRSEPLDVKIAASGGAAAASAAGASGAQPASPGSDGAKSPAPRRAALGSVPDFAFAGPGVRVQEVTKGSAAEKAGMKPGDVIVSFAGSEVKDLRGYSDLLKAHAPGESVEVVVIREGRRVVLKAALGER